MSRKTIVLAISLIVLLIFVVVALLPITHLKLGTVFFGQVPSLYNVQLAQYFFTYASYPLIGNPPPFAHYQLSRTHFIKGDLEESVREALEEIRVHPENKRTYYILGLTYGYMNKEREAISAFGEFIEAYPDSWAARNDRAWLQFRIGDVEGAMETLEPVSELWNPWVQNTKGTLLVNLDRLEEAKIAFLFAQQIASAMTYEDWGRAYPGNDPRIYETGLNAMRRSIQENLEMIARKEQTLSPSR
jgi:tetratricopeptide (TPR) repeat protein